MGKDWYLSEYKRKAYLHHQVLSFRPFPCAEGTHDHCELCWARFSKAPEDLHCGYYERHSKSWICEDCFREAASLFGWTLEDSTP